ncbi:MAG: leucine-rich repeat domain-containing protein, partial [Rikenellaceae bacterium]
TLKKGAITEKLTLNTTQFADNKSDVTTADSSYVWTDLLADDALLAVEQSGDEGEVTYKYYNNTGAETDSEGTVLDTGSGEGGDDGEGNEPDTTTLSVVLDGTTLTVSNVASVALNNSVKGTLTDGVDQTCYTVCTNHVALTAAEGEDIETARTTAMAELSGINNAVQAAITAETLSSDYLSTATKIVVTGEVNAADFSYLYERFSEIDLSGATFVGYGSAGNASNATLACIPFAAFYMDTVTTKFSTPSNTEVFGNRVFHLATSLTDVTLATTVKELKYWAFYDCTKLANINLDDAVIATVGDGVFYNCNVMNYTSYSEMKLSITTIGYQTFLGCKLLETLDLTEDDGITTIRQQSFKNCTGLTSVNIPSTVTTIAPTNDTTTTLNTFDGCTALATVTLNWDADDTISISYPENLFPSQFFKDSGTASITIPDGVTNVAIYNTLADTYSLKHENGGAYVTTYVFADENFGTAFSAAYGGYSTASAAELATIETLSLDSADITSFADVAAFTGLTSLTLDGCTGCTELDITASASLTSVSAPSVTKLTMTAAQATTFNVTKGVDATHSESLTLAEGYSIYVDGVCFAGVD